MNPALKGVNMSLCIVFCSLKFSEFPCSLWPWAVNHQAVSSKTGWCSRVDFVNHSTSNSVQTVWKGGGWFCGKFSP